MKAGSNTFKKREGRKQCMYSNIHGSRQRLINHHNVTMSSHSWLHENSTYTHTHTHTKLSISFLFQRNYVFQVIWLDHVIDSAPIVWTHSTSVALFGNSSLVLLHLLLHGCRLQHSVRHWRTYSRGDKHIQCFDLKLTHENCGCISPKQQRITLQFKSTIHDLDLQTTVSNNITHQHTCIVLRCHTSMF